MFWIPMLLAAQTLDCGIEPELKLPPAGDFRPVSLDRVKAAKGFESWTGHNLLVTRRIADGAVGLKMGGREVGLKPMGLLGVEGTGQAPFGKRGFDTAPQSVRLFRNALVPGAAHITVQASGTVYVAARCQGHLALVEWEGKGPQAMDVNGDGKVDVNSPAEYARVQGGVFELDGKGYQFAGIDWGRRVLVLRQAPLGPKLNEGDLVENFTYVDRLKERRTLESHQDSFTLLDYWASWCGPCIAAFPQLTTLAETYQLKILGLNGDEDPAAASRVLAQFGVLWPDVQGSEPGWLYDSRLRVGLYPTYVLIDPSRRVVARTESTLSLIETVRRLVPRRKPN